MKCQNCGSKISSKDVYCTNCGEKVELAEKKKENKSKSILNIMGGGTKA